MMRQMQQGKIVAAFRLKEIGTGLVLCCAACGCYNWSSDKTNKVAPFDGLHWDAMICRQKIATALMGNIVQQSARADVVPIIVVYNSCNGILLDIAVA